MVVLARTYSQNIFNLLGSKSSSFAKVGDSFNSLVNHLTVKPVALISTLIVDDDLACPGATYSTISAAVAAAIAGDTIRVCAGTYNEFVTVDKTLIILGAQNGVDARTRAGEPSTESIVNSMGSPTFDVGFFVRANGVVIDGFIVQDGTTSGIFSEGTYSGYQFLNNIIQNNTIGLYLNNNGAQQTVVRNNAFKTNNLPGSASGDGIYSDQGARVLIDANSFDGHAADSMIFNGTQANITISGNQLTSNNKSMVFLSTNGLLITGNTVINPLEKGIELDGGNNDVLITCNTIVGSPFDGISVINPHDVGPNTGVRIDSNNIQGNLVAGLDVSIIGYTGTLNAENNYWGSSTGPTIDSNPGGTGNKIVDPNNVVDYMPFLTAPSMCAPPLPTPTPTPTPTPMTPIVSGRVTYANSLTTTSVPFTMLNAAGSPLLSTLTDVNGFYSLSGFGSGTYTITPSKTGQVNGISNLDASRVAQHIVGLTTLNPTQLIAADTSGNGVVSSLDAAYIAQFVASIANPGQTGRWKFVPASRSYPNVQSSQMNQDYSAILVGEVTGNWNPAGALGFDLLRVESEPTAEADKTGQPVAVSARLSRAAAEDTTLTFNLSAADVTGKGILAYQFDVLYDAAVIEPQAASCDASKTLSGGMTAICRMSEPGVLKVMVYGTTPMTGEGTLLKLNFKMIAARGSASGLSIKDFMFNEGVPSAVTVKGQW